ncbi:hypothetical protein ACOSQ2_015643 [Xanthoceras sorbifolium]
MWIKNNRGLVLTRDDGKHLQLSSYLYEDAYRFIVIVLVRCSTVMIQHLMLHWNCYMIRLVTPGNKFQLQFILLLCFGNLISSSSLTPSSTVFGPVLIIHFLHRASS